jgi:ADP-heptose:LPS heptosyltransferase
MNFQSIVISRTDSIGDVVLTLPMAGWLKQHYPGVQITFLGAAYTKEVVEACVHVDRFVDWDSLVSSQQSTVNSQTKPDLFIHVFPRKEIAKWARKEKIALRLGTAHRLYHWNTCNKLVFFTRKRSELHEAQLNFKLLEGLTGKAVPSLAEIEKLYGFEKIAPLDESISGLLDNSRFNLILHPKSKGSAREWGLENFRELIRIVPQDKCKIFITGTENEGNLLKEAGFWRDDIPAVDLTGKLSLAQLLAFINAADGLIAASTGPLHLAAAMGKHTIGLYPPIRPMHPGRWAPVGKNASFLTLDKNCSKCRKTGDCDCIRQITPQQVLEKLTQNL